MSKIWLVLFKSIAKFEFAVAEKLGESAAVTIHFFLFWLLPAILVLLPGKTFEVAGIAIALFYIFILLGDHFFSVFGHEKLEKKRGMIDISTIAEIREAIESAILKYVGIIVSYATIYCGLQDYSQGKAFVIANSSGSQYYDLLYYSLITIATVGYGDILPASWPAKLFAMTEILFGMAYVLLLFTLLITVYIDIQKNKP
jgi:hypothetical protein